MGMAKDIVAARPAVHSVIIASNSSHCHLANGILNTNILLSHAVCPSLCRCGFKTKKVTSEIERVYQLHCRLCSATPLDCVAVTKFKPLKF